MIRFCNVSFFYREGEIVLEDTTFEIGSGLSLLLGPNGCGKSTLMKLAAGVECPDRGTVEIDGHDLWRSEIEARKDLAYIPEQPDLTPYATIRDVIYLVCRLRKAPLDRGREVLERLSLSSVCNRSIRELSMGQRRRAVLAAAWIGFPRQILLDEPLEAMDRALREEIVAWIDRLIEEGATILLATHEIEPFVGKTARAITVQNRKSHLFDDLPEDAARKLEFLEKLSRHTLPPIGIAADQA